MARVHGVGGVFIKARDPKALREWYKLHLGFALGEWGGLSFSWGDPEGPGAKGATIFSIFDEKSKYFDPSESRVMINFIVSDLEGLLKKLRDEGCKVEDKLEKSEYGHFGWVYDPEGHKIELWQPPESSPQS